MTTNPSLVRDLADALLELTPSQLHWIEGLLRQFHMPSAFWRDDRSELISEAVLHGLGDALRIHHALSRQPLSKDRFEYAFERSLILSGVDAVLAPNKTNRGHDITIAGIPVSLKTQADGGIRLDHLHISKFMELGKGAWELERLRDAFLEHMQAYEMILQLRCLEQGPTNYLYELVEIPKQLLLEVQDAELTVQTKSKQTPKPGYGRVFDPDGNLKFALYFDGGTERKLQIKSLRKDLCRTHATWAFESLPLEQPRLR